MSEGCRSAGTLLLDKGKAWQAMRFAHREGCIAVPMVGFLQVLSGLSAARNEPRSVVDCTNMREPKLIKITVYKK